MTSTRHPYRTYRPSGVEWFGEVPEHWGVRRLSRSVSRSDDRVGSEDADGMPYVGLEHVASWTGRLLPIDDQLTPESISNSFAAGDVLFGKLRPYLAKAFCAGFGGQCSTEFLVLRPREYVQPYLLYLLLTDGFVSLVDSSTYRAKMPRANWDFVCDAPLPLPPLAEQRAIAAFLDRETERIDALVAKQRQLIEQLEEYRTALITRTVTRGLPPKPPAPPASTRRPASSPRASSGSATYRSTGRSIGSRGRFTSPKDRSTPNWNPMPQCCLWLRITSSQEPGDFCRLS